MRRGLIVALAVAIVTQRSAADEAPYFYRVLTVNAFQMPLFDLLEKEPVQRDLGMTKEQRERHAAIERRRVEQVLARRRDKPEQFRELLRESRREAEKPALANLDQPQRERLDQIQLQVHGAAAFALAALPPRLEMTDEQIAAARKIIDADFMNLVEATRIPLPHTPTDRAFARSALQGGRIGRVSSACRASVAADLRFHRRGRSPRRAGVE